MKNPWPRVTIRFRPHPIPHHQDAHQTGEHRPASDRRDAGSVFHYSSCLDDTSTCPATIVGNKRFLGVLFIKSSMHAWSACKATENTAPDKWDQIGYRSSRRPAMHGSAFGFQ